MATQTTGGGSTTSFTNTPQAKDDNYLFLEDALRNNASLYSETTKIITLDVMSNDLGGNAKTLFSVEDGDGNAITADFDLLCKDVNAAGVSEWECTFGGNWVRINNGKIEYVIADGSGVKGQGRSVDSLTDGEAFSDQFVYAIRLGNGTLSEATVKINITGKQDAASIAVSGASDNCVVEAGGTANGVAGDSNACGTLSVTDKDSGENKFKPVTGSLDGNYGTFTFDENSGKWTYTLDNSRPATEALAEGDSKTESLTVYSFDGSDSYVIQVTVKGTNDAPVAVADSGTTSENAALLVNVLANDTDADDGHVLTVTSASAPAGQGSASVVGNQVQFDPGTDFDHLAVGDSAIVTVSYSIKDEHGATASSTVQITVTGTNDGPVAVDDTGAGNEDTLISGNVGTNDTDADDGHSLSYSLVGSAPAGFDLNPNGNWSLDASNSAYQHLAAGATTVVTVGYTVSDGLGGSDTGELKITVTGVNDNPALTAAQASLAAGTEDQNYIVSKVSLLQGFTDVDDGTVLNVSGLSANHGTVVNNGDGTFTIQPELNYNGPVTLSYSVIDGQGGSVPATLQFNLAAVNDPAVITGTSSGTVVEDAVPNTVGGNLNSTDVDGVNDSWTVVSSQTASANGYGTFTIDAAGNWVYSLNNGNGTVNALNNLQSLSDSFTVTTADGTTKVVNITINGHTDFTYTPPPLSNALDVNDHDDDHSGSVAGSLVIMAPGSGPNGTDVLEGSNGADTIYAGNSPDQVYGHNGGDHIYGENGADVSLYGQRGDDFIYGGNSDDTIYGGSGNDTIFGNSDPNSGGASNDTIYGGSGRDTIDGQDGNDVINGGNGQDLLTGGDGNDIFVYQKATDTGDFIFDFQQGSDKIDLTAFNFDAADFVGAIAGAGQVGAGQFGYMTYNNGTTTVTTIYVDTDGVFGADMEITIVAPVTLTGSDFLI